MRRSCGVTCEVRLASREWRVLLGNGPGGLIVCSPCSCMFELLCQICFAKVTANTATTTSDHTEVTICVRTS